MNDLELLSSLDPARDWEPDPARRARSAALIDELTASSATSGAIPHPSKRQSRWSSFSVASRWGLATSAAVAACAAITGVLIVPGLLPGDVDAAYASWTPVPEQLTGAEALPEAQRCAAGWTEGWANPPTAADVMLAERRGIATTLLVTKDDGGLVVCDILDPADGVAGASALDPEAVVPEAGRVSVESQGASGDKAWYSQIVGRVGPGVTDVDVVLPDDSVIRATTRSGWWLAWWPGREGNGMGEELSFVVHTAAGAKTYRGSAL
ncbi:hypothetical protein [Actinoplanes couchii]|uniref:Uncharacterized protein n=1 Tax=Actinoplanes couchii TaxID=403638 RepID=A0ABQ3XHS6_9ACTN|nr:hypothetical protein [Actinoplanes couchii]MDR6317682.1 hypothetical protein [Actinoplanes couchii]GID58067.1 hypothetical protein Aco03nite_064710 [Actinoplanes couchii]